MDFDNLPTVPENADSLESSKQIELDLSKVELRKLTVIGESHGDKSISELVKQLMERGGYDSLYLEALYQGDYAIQGDNLKSVHNSVYAYDPQKYDDIIATAQKCGVHVYGIDANADRNEEVVDSWAEYITSGPDDNKLILVGDVHAVQFTYGDSSIGMRAVLPAYLLKRGIPRQDIFIISDALGQSPYQTRNMSNGLFYPSEFNESPFEEVIKRRQPIVDLIRIQNKK